MIWALLDIKKRCHQWAGFSKLQTVWFLHFPLPQTAHFRHTDRHHRSTLDLPQLQPQPNKLLLWQRGQIDFDWTLFVNNTLKVLLTVSAAMQTVKGKNGDHHATLYIHNSSLPYCKITIEVGKLGHIVLYFNLNHRYINN